jgi:hypothetical protein
MFARAAVSQFDMAGEPDRQRAVGEAVLGRGELAPDRIAALAVERLAGAKFALGDGDDIATPSPGAAPWARRAMRRTIPICRAPAPSNGRVCTSRRVRPEPRHQQMTGRGGIARGGQWHRGGDPAPGERWSRARGPKVVDVNCLTPPTLDAAPHSGLARPDLMTKPSSILPAGGQRNVSRGARAHVVTCASQSNVGKSLIIGAKRLRYPHAIGFSGVEAGDAGVNCGVHGALKLCFVDMAM